MFFATVFLQFDGTTEKTPENIKEGIEWLKCVLDNGGDKNKCLDLASALVVPEATALAILFLLSVGILSHLVNVHTYILTLNRQLNGIWALILLGNYKLFTGWFYFFKGLFTSKKTNDEFVSYNARGISEPHASSYEMLDSLKNKTVTPGTNVTTIIKPPEPLSLSVPREYNPSTFSAQLRGRSDSGVYPQSARMRSDSNFSGPPCSPAGGNLQTNGGPYSPYKDSPSLTGGQFPPYRVSDKVVLDNTSVNSRTPKYPPDAKIGIGLAS